MELHQIITIDSDHGYWCCRSLIYSGFPLFYFPLVLRLRFMFLVYDSDRLFKTFEDLIIGLQM